MNNEKVTLSDVQNELMRRVQHELDVRSARTSLVDFIKITKPDYLFGWFNRELCAVLEQFLQDVIDKKSPRLIISAPPRHGKSEIVSRRFPAWALGLYPTLNIMNASYSSELASSFNRDVQAIIDTPEFYEVFPECVINGEYAKSVGMEGIKNLKKTADFFETIQKGYMFSGGVGGAFTGFGANCLTGDTMIDTTNGKVSIKDISIGSTVICYNERTHKLECGRVIAKKVSYASEIYRLCDNQGRSLKSTGEHQIFTGTGYNKANTITEGTDLLCLMRKRTHNDDVRLQEGGFKRLYKSVLQQEMCGTKRAFKRHPKAQMSNVWQTVCQTCEVLFRMFENCPKKTERRYSADRENMLNLWEGFFGQSCWQREFCNVLLKGLQEQGSINNDEWIGQCEIQKRDQCSKRNKQSKKGILPGETACEEKGTGLCFMWGNREPSASPYRLESVKQYFIKCCKNLYRMSQRMSQTGNIGNLQSSFIQSIERIHHETLIPVYDIQVEGCNNNYFANGILVHNCFIVDDPLKNREEAESETIREKLWGWYTSTAYTRLSQGGGMIIMNTRWSSEDLTGKLLQAMLDDRGDKYTIFEFPAIATHDETYRKEGEALFPERFSLHSLEQIKLAVGAKDWASLYQQSPIPDGGGMFKEKWIQYYDELPDHFDKIVMAFDMTFKDTKKSDYVAGQVWIKEKGAFYFVDQVRGRFDFVTTLKKFVEFTRKHDYCVRKLIEDKANGTAVINVLRKNIIGIVPIVPKESKEARASAVTTVWEAHNVYIPNPAKYKWVEQEFIPELLSFPGGKHDDQIDCMTMCLNDMLGKSGHIDPTNIELLTRGMF